MTYFESQRVSFMARIADFLEAWSWKSPGFVQDITGSLLFQRMSFHTLDEVERVEKLLLRRQDKKSTQIGSLFIVLWFASICPALCYLFVLDLCFKTESPVRVLRRNGSRWSPPCWSQVVLAMWQRALAVTRCDKMWNLKKMIYCKYDYIYIYNDMIHM